MWAVGTGNAVSDTMTGRGRRPAGPARGTPTLFRRRALAAGLALVVAAGTAYGGYALLHRRAVQKQQRSYAAGHRGYQAGDCAAALPDLAAAARGGPDAATAAKARTERDACRGLVAAGSAGNPAARLAAYFGYAERAPDPLRSAAAAAAQALILQSPTQAAADLTVCRTQAELVGARFLPPATAGDGGPDWLAGCMATAEQAKDWFLAGRLAETLLREYPKSERADATTRSLIRYEVLQATTLPETRPLEPWDPDARRSGEKALVRVTNGLPYELRLLFVGPTTVELRLPGCSDCSSSPRAGQACTGPDTQVELVPGRYQVMVDYIIGFDAVGTMPLRSNQAYERCFLPRA